MNEHDNPLIDFVVVIRSGTRLRLLPNETIEINASIDGNMAVIRFQTHYADEGFESTVPRELFIDARGKASSLENAIVSFTNLANFLTFIISFCANGYVGNCNYHIAYDNTPGLKERAFFEQFIESEHGLPAPSRRIPSKCVTSVIDILATHEHTDRLRLAIVQYVYGLSYWKKGEEILAVSHIYMGIEALVPAIRKIEMKKLGLIGNQQLADHYAIPKKDLDSYLRRMIIFCGNKQCHDKSKEVSDGVEHGFLQFDEIRPLAIEVRNAIAGYLRNEIISLLKLPDEIKSELLKQPYDKPIGIEGYIRYLRGKLISDHDRIAADGQEYPIIDWSFKVKMFKQLEESKLQFSFDSKLTPQIGAGVQFSPKTVEIYGPEGIIPEANPIRELINPEITPSPKYSVPRTDEEFTELIQTALKDGELLEMKIQNKDGSILVIGKK